jgi:hypothetical protein
MNHQKVFDDYRETTHQHLEGDNEMRRDYESKRPPALLTYDEMGFYLGINPHRITALELVGENDAEFFSIYDTAVKRSDDMLCFPIESDRRYAGLDSTTPDFRLGPSGIFQVNPHGEIIAALKEVDGRLVWESVKTKERTLAESRVYLCRPIG